MTKSINNKGSWVVVNDMNNIDGWKKIISSHRSYAAAQAGERRAQPKEQGSYLPCTILYKPEIEGAWARWAMESPDC